MNSPDAAWEARVADLWQAIETYAPEEFVARLDLLVGELPPDSAIGHFERGSARDSTGNSRLAVPLYRAALAAGDPSADTQTAAERGLTAPYQPRKAAKP